MVVAAPALAVVASPASGAVAAAGTETPPAGPDAVLVVEDAETGRTLLGIPVENGTNVSLVYTHSVEKTRVVDTYEVRGDRLVMTRMEFASFGAGLPSRAEVHRIGNDTYAFDPEGAYEELYVSPGRIADHRLRVDGRSYDLVALSNATSVRLHVAGCEAGEPAGPGATADGTVGTGAATTTGPTATAEGTA